MDSILPKNSLVQEETKDLTFEEELEGLHKEYLTTLSEKIDNLKQWITAAKEAKAFSDDMDSAYRLAHKLHGSAGSYGFYQISQSMAEIEFALKALIDRSEPMDGSEVWHNIDQALASAELRVKSITQNAALPRTADSQCNGTKLKGKLLILDDDASFLKESKLIGEHADIGILTASTPAEAFEKLGKYHIDGMILDVILAGGQKSFQLVKEFQSFRPFSPLPITFVTAEDSLEVRVAAAQAGGFSFLTKPLSRQDLLEAFHDLILESSAEKPKILILDDDVEFSRQLLTIFEYEGIEATHIVEPQGILEALSETQPDILLLDVLMPGLSGLDICKMLRMNAAWKSLPIILLTVHSDLDARITAFEAGADDYIEKPCMRKELMARIGTRIERARLYKDRLERDALTGLLQRNVFLQRFSSSFSEATRRETPISLCILDLDNFKQVNDTQGHMAGDAVLIGLGKLLKARFRLNDLRGRWGGEEFIIALNNQNCEKSKEILERVLEEFSSIEFTSERSKPFHCTFSAGIASYPDDGTTYEELFKKADERLYLAKSTGRNQIVIA